MAQLTLAQYLGLSRHWLNIWRDAGSPVIQADARHVISPRFGRNGLAFGDGAIAIEHSGRYAKWKYCGAALLRVSCRGITITPLICQLNNERLSGGDFLAIPEVGSIDVLATLAYRMELMHIEAALHCVDPTALVGFTSEEACAALSKIQAKVLSKEIGGKSGMVRKPSKRV